MSMQQAGRDFRQGDAGRARGIIVISTATLRIRGCTAARASDGDAGGRG
jgi:hypothetical protein